MSSTSVPTHAHAHTMCIFTHVCVITKVMPVFHLLTPSFIDLFIRSFALFLRETKAE